MFEHKKKSRIEQIRDWYELVQIRKRRHQSIWYLSYFVLMVLLYASMILSGVFIKSNTDVISTPIGNQFTLNTRTYTLYDKKIDKENGQAVFVLTNPEEPLTDIHNNLEASVEFINASDHNTQATVIQGDRGYYVIILENLPEKYSAMRVLFELSIDGEPSEGEILVNGKEEPSEEFSVPSEVEVFVQSIEFMIDDRNNQLEHNQKIQADNLKSIDENLEKINILEDSKTYMTEREISDTNTSIQQLELAISNLEARNRTIDLENDELEKQVSNLKERIAQYSK